MHRRLRPAVVLRHNSGPSWSIPGHCPGRQSSLAVAPCRFSGWCTIAKGECSRFGPVTMLSQATPASSERCFGYWRRLVPWLCAVSLLIALANRVPRFPSGETCWVSACPSQATVKLQAKSLYQLPPLASGIFALRAPTRVRRPAEQAHPLLLVSSDNRLCTRPPPAPSSASLS